jgi:hypothetical protein
MCPPAALVLLTGPVRVFVGRIQHQLDIAEPEPDPRAAIGWLRSLNDLEPEEVAVETQGRRHVKDMEKGDGVRDSEGHVVLPLGRSCDLELNGVGVSNVDMSGAAQRYRAPPR